jgi:hypothetical protein
MSPARVDPVELLQKAISIREEKINKEKEEKIIAYRETVDKTNLTETIVTAAYNGQVDTLFLTRNHIIWGNFDRELAKTEAHSDFQNEDMSLNNFASIHTILKDGEVILLDKEALPDPSRPMNAILRYRI